MRFVVGNQWWPSAPAARPCVTMRLDHWDDYGFKTMWSAKLWLRSGRIVELGGVKIVQREQSHGRTLLPEAFEQLEEDFCSLGQAPSYYETLHAANLEEPGVAEAYLTAMRDAAADPRIREDFEDTEGFKVSLLRETAAVEALEHGRAVLNGRQGSRDGAGLTLRFSSPGLTDSLDLRFNYDADLPSRIYALIGYNGVGKTRLLANLGMVAATDRRRQRSTTFRDKHGRFHGEAPDISAVICVSYSAFDRFPVPRQGSSHLGRSYAYIGLRKVEPNAADDADGGAIELKGLDVLEDEFHEARERTIGKMREGQLEKIFAPLLVEPSFAMAGHLPALDGDRAEWETAIGLLSTGHAIVLNVLVQLCARLEQRSLLLIDEPEMHLHPPLVAALLSSIQVALTLYDSYAVVATHSPVVTQEIPAEKVLMLRRAAGRSRIDPPETETFGENISVLTDRIFSLDNSRSDFRRVLLQLLDERSPDEVAALFPNGLSAQAWAIVIAEQARRSRT